MDLFYRAGQLMGRFAFFCAMRLEVTDPQTLERQGGFILAVTHLSHLEPVCLSILSRRPLDWMTRKEFYRYRPIVWLLDRLGAFCVNRQGVPVSAIRTAIRRVGQGRAIGICPEGGVTTGAQSAIRGGTIRKGCCSIALRGPAPVIPCVMLGTHRLNAVVPWLPLRRTRLWVAYGSPIHPPAGARSTRATRAELAARIEAEFRRLYAVLGDRYGIDDATIP